VFRIYENSLGSQKNLVTKYLVSQLIHGKKTEAISIAEEIMTQCLQSKPIFFKGGKIFPLLAPKGFA
jgi:hypothetical protein